MTLRARLGAWATIFAAATVVGFGSLALSTYQRQMHAQLEQLLRQDLLRVATLLERPSLGASFGGSGAEGVILQLVASEGRVVLWWGDDAPLPLTNGPTRLQRGERTYLATHAPWPAAAGTIRLAHDITAALQTARDLTRVLVTSGVVVVLAATLIALVGVRRTLAPLVDLARQTRSLEPAAPEPVSYSGPNDEVRDLAAGLNAALDAVRQRQREERSFLLEVAHELAAPLTLVHYHLDQLRRREPGDDALHAAADAARELLRTSQDLLVLARGELDREVEYHVLDLRDVLSRVSHEYPGVRLDAGDAAEVAGDAERLMQVVRNVVRNAVQASGEEGGVRVALRTVEGTHVVEVRDRGPGMTRETRERVFERGFTRGAGAGVGLAVARSLVERHGGTVRVASSSAEGSVVEIRLPSIDSRIAERTPVDHDTLNDDPVVSLG